MLAYHSLPRPLGDYYNSLQRQSPPAVFEDVSSAFPSRQPSRHDNLREQLRGCCNLLRAMAMISGDLQEQLLGCRKSRKANTMNLQIVKAIVMVPRFAKGEHDESTNRKSSCDCTALCEIQTQ